MGSGITYHPIILDSIGILQLRIPDKVDSFNYMAEFHLNFVRNDSSFVFVGELMRRE